MKHVWLIRHAKSSWPSADAQGSDGSDFARQLSPRGHRDGTLMQDYFARLPSKEWRPEWLISSAATRAQQTSQYVAEGVTLSADKQVIDPQLYLAEPETLLDALRETPPDIDCSACVAHNPGMTWLVNALSKPEERIDNLPTFGCALFAFDCEHWFELNAATRLQLITPKQFKTPS